MQRYSVIPAIVRNGGNVLTATPHGEYVLYSEAQALIDQYRDAAVKAIAETQKAQGEIDRLTKENKILTLKCASSLANNLCSDHRDKQAGKPCLACEIDRLTAERDADRRREYGYSQQTVDALTRERDGLRELVDGVTELVETWGTTPGQIQWRKEWLGKARAALKEAT